MGTAAIRGAPVFHLVLHPWRQAPTGDMALVLDADKPSLHLATLAPGTEAKAGAVVQPDKVVGVFALYKSPDPRAPDVAKTSAKLIAEVWPAWLEKRVLELLNNIGGFGTAKSAGRYRAAMRTMDRDAPEDLGHPLAPLGIWGGHVQNMTQAVRKGRFKDWKDLASRVDPMLADTIRESVESVLLDDIRGRTPRMLLRDPI